MAKTNRWSTLKSLVYLGIIGVVGIPNFLLASVWTLAVVGGFWTSIFPYEVVSGGGAITYYTGNNPLYSNILTAISFIIIVPLLMAPTVGVDWVLRKVLGDG